MRHKEVHAINAHPSLKFALDFGMSLISEKIKKRIKIYTSLDDALKNKMDPSMLPKEYGGTMPMKEMIGKLMNYQHFPGPTQKSFKYKISKYFWGTIQSPSSYDTERGVSSIFVAKLRRKLSKDSKRKICYSRTKSNFQRTNNDSLIFIKHCRCRFKFD